MLQGEHSTILSNFIKQPFVIKIFILSIFEWTSNSSDSDQNVGPNQVWGIAETRDQNYGSNARPRLRLADLLTEVVILQLRRCSER